MLMPKRVHLPGLRPVYNSWTTIGLLPAVNAVNTCVRYSAHVSEGVYAGVYADMISSRCAVRGRVRITTLGEVHGLCNI